MKDARLSCPCRYTLISHQALNVSRMMTGEGEEHAMNRIRAALVVIRQARCHNCIHSRARYDTSKN